MDHEDTELETTGGTGEEPQAEEPSEPSADALVKSLLDTIRGSEPRTAALGPPETSPRPETFADVAEPPDRAIRADGVNDETASFDVVLPVPKRAEPPRTTPGFGDVWSDETDAAGDSVEGELDAMSVPESPFWRQGPEWADPLTGAPRAAAPIVPEDRYRRRAGRSIIPGVDEPGRRLTWRAVGKWTAILVAAVIVLITVFAGIDVLAYRGRVHRGVLVAGIAVGSKTPGQVATLTQQRLGPVVSEPLVVRLEQREWTIQPTEIGAELDVAGTVRAAYAVGRQGNIFKRLGQRMAAWWRPQTVAPVLKLDTARLADRVAQIGKDVYVAPRDATATVNGVDVQMQPAAVGIELKSAQVTTEIRRHLLATDKTFTLPVAFVPVAVSDADARGAVDTARKMVAGPVTLVYGTRTWSVPAQSIGSWIRFRAMTPDQAATATSGVMPSTTLATSTSAFGTAAPAPSASSGAATPTAQRMVLVAYIDSTALAATVAPMVDVVGKAPKDARFVIQSGLVTILPSQIGTGLDAVSLAQTLQQVLAGGVERRATVRLTVKQPAVTTAMARGMGIKERISTYTTTFSSSNLPRVNNIKLLAKALDGKLIAPGAVFSFNGAVGERTASKGYQEAPAIVNGKLLPQLGGGICQVGTTIFNTVFFSGLPVIERHNHSQYISHYPKGRDATVSWGGPDFKFQNTTTHWILLKTSASNSDVTISLYGTNPHYTVEYTTGAFTDVVKFTTQEIQDATLPTGSRVVEESGSNGSTVKVVRTVKLSGKVVRTDTFVSRYDMKVQVVRVGTKPASTPTSTTP